MQGVSPPRIHGLVDLLNQCMTHDATQSSLMPQALALNQYAVEIRYPGTSSTMDEAKEAIKEVRAFRSVLRKKLGL